MSTEGVTFEEIKAFILPPEGTYGPKQLNLRQLWDWAETELGSVPHLKRLQNGNTRVWPATLDQALKLKTPPPPSTPCLGRGLSTSTPLMDSSNTLNFLYSTTRTSSTCSPIIRTSRRHPSSRELLQEQLSFVSADPSFLQNSKLAVTWWMFSHMFLHLYAAVSASSLVIWRITAYPPVYVLSVPHLDTLPTPVLHLHTASTSTATTLLPPHNAPCGKNNLRTN